MKTPDYPFEIHPLSEDDGGGWLVTFPDLPGCTADGATIEEAVMEAADAEAAWLKANKKWGQAAPDPGRRLVAQVPRELLESLEARARREGVSLEHLVAGFISDGLSANANAAS